MGGKGSKEEESGAAAIQKHVKQNKQQKPSGGQQPKPAPDGEEPIAKKDVGKVKKPEVSSDRQEPTTTIGKGSKEEENGSTAIQSKAKARGISSRPSKPQKGRE